eukprot:TRINITY_DN2566_c0_g1_i1.p1 TRINITY_DN2566_c0_g1~~TRINITY_DN2566_c0_g1_i1.p1  ORF type:complete len:578 (-),score=144.49 TRINITY_DN2566_c0_g1_i1:136-1680(-)
MAYSLWKNGRHERPSVFDLYFRKNPFHGEFTIFGGLEEAVRFLSDFKFKEDQIESLRMMMGPHIDPGFFEWLATLDCSQVTLVALKEGSVVFPRIPLLRVEGPMGVVQLLETTLLCLVNFASLVATNAARHRLAVGKGKEMLEFGLRRAQGPDGGLSASRYTYLGGADGTSNVLAAALFGIPVKGTHAHSYVTSFSSPDDLKDRSVVAKDGSTHDLWERVLAVREELGFTYTNQGELVAFTAYARTFPHAFLALVDTYDTISSGVPNFLTVATTLHRLGYKALGIRLDSGDLAYLSKEARRMFHDTASKVGAEFFRAFTIVASNDLNEETIVALNRQGHEINTFAIGTHLVTCQAQPALGCVYKLVELDGHPRIKLSQEVAKVTLPSRKTAYRLYGSEGHPLVDILVPFNAPEDQIPQVGKRILCLHPFEEQKRVFVTPTRVECLHHVIWQGKLEGKLPTLEENKKYCTSQVAIMREDHLRYLNPTPYKVSVSQELYNMVHELWLQEVPIRDLK